MVIEILCMEVEVEIRLLLAVFPRNHRRFHESRAKVSGQKYSITCMTTHFQVKPFTGTEWIESSLHWH